MSPQADEDLRSRWDDESASAFLRARGFTCTRFTWTPPTNDHEVTEEEWSAINYVVDEWDYEYEASRA